MPFCDEHLGVPHPWAHDQPQQLIAREKHFDFLVLDTLGWTVG